uniref:Zinc finger protein 385C n=1 Tax=Scleropages formosus TaxID=113540 RepID=A0A8C9SFK7_SCLFO
MYCAELRTPAAGAPPRSRASPSSPPFPKRAPGADAERFASLVTFWKREMLGTEERGDAGGRRSGRGMKRGFSPAGPLRSSPSPERGPRSGAGHRSGTLEHRPKRERKHKTYTLCEVCNIQLNSAAQAQIHYNGKSHQKRLKQISSGKSHGCTGSPSQSSSLLAALPVSGRPVQPQLDLKHLLPFQLNGSSPLSLFPNFNAMDPVQKAVINHTFGVPQPLKKKPVISCNICHLRFNSANQAEAHYKGHKHSRKLKALEAQKNKQRRLGEVAGRQRERERDKAGAVEGVPTSVDGSLHPDPEPAKQEEVPGSSVMLTPMSEVSSPELAPLASPHVSPASQGSSASDVALEPGCVDPSSSEPDTSNEGDVDSKNSKQHLHCPVCNVTVNSVSQLEAHNSGTPRDGAPSRCIMGFSVSLHTSCNTNIHHVTRTTTSLTAVYTPPQALSTS